MADILHRNERVEWEVTEGPEEWVGTHVRFDLKPESQRRSR